MTSPGDAALPVVAQPVLRLHTRATGVAAVTSTVLGKMPMRRNRTSDSPSPARWIVLTAPAELKLIPAGVG